MSRSNQFSKYGFQAKLEDDLRYRYRSNKFTEYGQQKDLDGDGLIEDGPKYQLASADGPVTLKSKWGTTYSDSSSSHWDAEAATQTKTGFKVLLDGDGAYDGKHYVWSTDSNGVITKGSGWKTTSEAVELGWENTFSRDMDGDGLIEGGKYQMASTNGPVELRNAWGGTYSDSSSTYWDAEAATQTNTGFKVLLDGDGVLNGKHYVWDTNTNGVITKGSGWKTSEQAVRLNWEHDFGRDINLDGFIGSRIFDASGDSSKKEVFEDGALEISYCGDTLSTLKADFAPEMSFWGMTWDLPGWVSASVTATKASTGEVVDLGSSILDLSKDSFYVNLKDELEASEGWFDRRSSWSIDVDINAEYVNGSSVNLEDFDENITMIDALDIGSSYRGDVTANTFNYNDYDGFLDEYGSGRIYRGRGGTDTLVLNGFNKDDILKFNGSSVDSLGNSAAGGAALGQQAFYGGTVFDVLSLNNGDELYLQGIEKISCEDGDIRVRANMSNSTKEQWNLQAMDVSGAWRFNRGSSDVVLVSLDTGIGDIAGNPTDIDDEISHVVNKTAKNNSTSASSRDHGHHSMSVMGARHDSSGIAGIAPQSQLWAYNVWSEGVYDSIEGAKDDRECGQRLVFQNGAGRGWGGWGSTEAQMRDSIEETESYAFFSASAGNDNSTTGVAGAGGLAPFQTDFGNIASVGAVQFTDTEVVDGITNAEDTQIAWYSNEGADLTISAPTDSRAINGNGDLSDFGGTSCANPNLAGVAALVWSENTSLSGSDVRDLITYSAMDLGAVGLDDTFGHGMVNAEAAVRRSHALSENYELASFYSNDQFIA